jgi:hypothetical protein
MNTTTNNGTWANFTYHNPLVHKVTNMFENTNVSIAFRSINTIYHLLQYHPNREPSKLSVICMTCTKSYGGQSGRTIAVTYKEHIRYIRTSSPTSAYALRILNQRHDYGPLDNTLHLLKPCEKGNLINCW